MLAGQTDAAANVIRCDLPLAASRQQCVAGVLLAVLMIATRGQHFASVDALPSASWAVFFLAGMLLRPMWPLPVFFVLSSALDIGSFALGTITDWCLSPAYWALAFAYTVLWLGGRVYADRLHSEGWETVPRFALVLVVIGTLAYLVSKGGYWFFSGRYPDPTWQGLLARVPRYYPRAIGTLAGYAGAALALRAAWYAMTAAAAREAERRA